MKNLRSTLVAAGAAFGMTLAGLGVADAQTSEAPPAAESTAPDQSREGRGPRGGGHRHGKGMGIHGEFVARNPEGGYQTIATQRGEVTESSATRLTVKSEDGFTRTYVVNDDTRVNGGNDGMGDVAVGDQVHVHGIVDGDTTTAKSIHEPRPKPEA